MNDSDADALSDASSIAIITPLYDTDLWTRLDREITEDLTNQTEKTISEDSDNSKDSQPVQQKDRATQYDKMFIQPRAYQLEMFEESLKRNIIVAMDTGSGKTHVACLRIAHELDIMASHQLVWFLAPQVVLGAQQYEYFRSQITAVQIIYLSGSDGCDRWTDQRIWDALLENVKVVVSTPQILLDALTHGFVSLDRLALLIFDEAHSCAKKSPGAKIMTNFYHKAKITGNPFPKILGLTASALTKSDPNSLFHIEKTLDCVCRTPTKNRLELQTHVKVPAFVQIFYNVSSGDRTRPQTTSLASLERVFFSLDISEDPYILALKSDDSERSQRELAKLLLNHKTWVQQQMKRLLETSIVIYTELGPWAVDYYIHRIVENSKSLTETSGVDGFVGSQDASGSEKRYLHSKLRAVEISDRCIVTHTPTSLFSDKVNKLVETLLSQTGEVRGIVFVTRRATAEVLAVLLRTHPLVRNMFKFGTFVGTSTSTHRTRDISEVVDFETQKHVLDKFRKGDIDIVIATDVLEEGVDVPACNLVVCFDKPSNLKSFVQRRGRARQKDSQLILFLDSENDKGRLAEFQALEEKMKQLYMDDSRELDQLIAAEEAEQHIHRTYRIPTSGALLDLDNAISHLYHFCSTLPAKEFVDLRPEFICERENNLITAKVILPLSVTESVRTARSLTAWKSEKNATKDAAFEAYVALHKAGLVGDNLLPLMRHDGEAEHLLSSTMEKRISILEVREVFDPWSAISMLWQTTPNIYKSLLRVDDLYMEIFSPLDLPIMDPFQLHWDPKTVISVSLQNFGRATPDLLNVAIADTHNILQATYGHRFHVDIRQQPLSFTAKTPVTGTNRDLPAATNSEVLKVGLIRDFIKPNVPYMFRSYHEHKPQINNVQRPYIDYSISYNDEPHVSIKRLPKRQNFLQKVVLNPKLTRKEHAAVLPLSRTSIGDFSFEYVRFALMFPSILHQFNVYLVAQQLAATVLNDVCISSLELLRTAICASSAQESTNYQRLEFLGDSILKLCTSVQLMNAFPLWHEGLLSFKKDRLVSNSRLAKAAIDMQLDNFVITQQFTGLKWRPTYIDDPTVTSETSESRQISSKVLADVVESLVGAAAIDGGIPKSLKCLSIFLPEMEWQSLATCQVSLYVRAPELRLPPVLEPVERILGYTFTKGSLLVEALTHASSFGSSSGSLERLEFLGDAILDNIVVIEMWNYNLSHYQMHLLRSAMVNADFLAWVCLESSIDLTITNIKTIDAYVERSTERWPLWRFLRHSSASLARAQQATTARHQLLRNDIHAAIESGTHYPWALLSRLEAGKFFSDMIESMLGAIWIDSCTRTPSTSPSPPDDTRKTEHSSLPAEPTFASCKAVLEHLGILPYMRRILRDDVHVLHPKEELGILADTETVKYVIDARKSEASEGLEYLCTVLIGDVKVVSVDGGISKVEVKTKAAECAVKLLKRGREAAKIGGGDAWNNAVGKNGEEEASNVNGNGDGGAMDIDS